MKIVDESAGEILVTRDPFRSYVEVRIKGGAADDYRVVRLARHEARRLAALILFQAEKLEEVHVKRVMGSRDAESKSV